MEQTINAESSGAESSGAESAGEGKRQSWEGDLAEAIVSRVVPKLCRSHSHDRPEIGERMRRRMDADRLRALVLSGRVERQWELLAALRDEGVPSATIYLDVMAPVVRQLGEMWEDDRMSFVDVTTKSAHLQQMLRRLGAEDLMVPSANDRRLLLGPIPNEQHTFGLFLLAELFIAAGWEVVVEPVLTIDHLAGLVAGRAYDAVGLSVGSHRHLPLVRDCVAAVRGASRSKDTKVLIGGWALMSQASTLEEYGADAIETDPHAAVAKAEELCSMAATSDGHAGERRYRG